MKKGSKKMRPEIKQPIYYEIDWGRAGIHYIPLNNGSFGLSDITDGIKHLLEDHSYKVSDLVKAFVSWKEKSGLLVQDVPSEDTSLRRYLNNKIVMPMDVMIDVFCVLDNLGKQLPEEESVKYFETLCKLHKMAAQYQWETSYFNEKLENLLEQLNELDADDIIRFLRSFELLSLGEETWCFWLCYATLPKEMREETEQILCRCTTPHTFHRLFSRYHFYAEEAHVLDEKILRARRAAQENQEALKKRLVSMARETFNRVPKTDSALKRICEIINLALHLDSGDWMVLLMYEYTEDCKSAIEFVLSAMETPTNYKSKCPEEVVHSFKERLVEQVDRREQAELEMMFLDD